ncbi:DUF7453 family protein [Aeoliella sp. SH292]|uniref:DUF7453 family protein n=1 Tax=Aeoliella sp. SH292 TaxID=3454464 RepID=UPI003F9D7F29
MKRRVAKFSVTVLVMAWSLGGVVLAESLSIVAVSGQSTPDDDGVFSLIFLSSLNNRGQIVFEAYLDDTNDGRDAVASVFRSDGASGLVEIVRNGVSDPSGTGRFRSMSQPSLNDAGEIAFRANLRTNDDTANFAGLYRGVGGNGLQEVFRSGQPAPDGDGIFGNAGGPVLNESDQIVFFSQLWVTNAVDGIFRRDGSAPIVQLARAGQSPPDGDGVFQRFNSLAINNSGLTTFLADIRDAHTRGDNGGIFGIDDSNGLMVEMVRTLDSVPVGHGFFNSLGNSALNERGQVVFSASIGGLGVEASEDSGLFLVQNGTGVTEIVREGQLTPSGDGEYERFGVFALNDAGQVSYHATIRNAASGSANLGGIFRSDDSGSAIEIVRSGEPVNGGDVILNFDSIALNNSGQTVFLGLLSSRMGTHVPAGLYFHDDALGLLQIARVGDSLLGSTITRLQFKGHGESINNQQHSGLNDLGQVAFTFDLADGRDGIAIWSPPATVPEPQSLVLVSALLLAACWVRSRGGVKPPRR